MSIASRPHRPGSGELVSAGHDVVVQWNAGEGSSISDDDFTAAGAKVLDTADAVWEGADLVLKVKEPIAEEYHRMRGDQMLFTYLHLAASQECTGPHGGRDDIRRGRDGPAARWRAPAAVPDE